jgi:hypothetical protein
MSAGKSVAGPWHVYTSRGFDRSRDRYIVFSDGTTIASDIASADHAALIAAAQDLLQALQNFCAGFEADEVHEGHYKTALAAIAKATGEQQ